MLRLTEDVYAEIVAHAVDGAPLETCGMIAAAPDSDLASRFYPIRNAAESPKLYLLDPAEYLAAERSAEDDGLGFIAVMHSHTTTTAYPSPTDVQDAANFDPFGALRYVIVSLRDPEPALRCYRILDGDITEEPVEMSG